MPTYGYRCDKGHEFEVFQGISEDPLTDCQVCAAPVRRIFYPVGIVYKGPGFYKTDSRGSSSSSTPAATTPDKSEAKTESKDSGAGKTKSDSKPAKTDKTEKKSA